MTKRKSAYTRPEIEVVPCMITAIMEPSIHARGSNWPNEDRDLNSWTNGKPSGYNPSGSFRFKSVWDATAKELQDGELVVVDVE